MSVEPKLIHLAIIAAVGAWGVTGCIKPVVKGFLREAWAKAAVRLSALISGAAFGFAIDPSSESAVAGVAGGAMSATIVGAIKAVIKKKSQSAIEDE